MNTKIDVIGLRDGSVVADLIIKGGDDLPTNFSDIQESLRDVCSNSSESNETNPLCQQIDVDAMVQNSKLDTEFCTFLKDLFHLTVRLTQQRLSKWRSNTRSDYLFTIQ